MSSTDGFLTRDLITRASSRRPDRFQVRLIARVVPGEADAAVYAARLVESAGLGCPADQKTTIALASPLLSGPPSPHVRRAASSLPSTLHHQGSTTCQPQQRRDAAVASMVKLELVSLAVRWCPRHERLVSLGAMCFPFWGAHILVRIVVTSRFACECYPEGAAAH